MLGEIEEFLTGGRSRTVARDLLTVIFSDIVGSTGHAARLGDARWRDLLGAHQTAVRREIEGRRARAEATVAMDEDRIVRAERQRNLAAGAQQQRLMWRVGANGLR